MSVVFESNIGVAEDGSWYIDLRDTQDGRVQRCTSIEEYSKSIEDFGSDYGGHIDEVFWSKDANVHPYIMNEIRALMMQEQEEIEARQGREDENI
jgi:hypothetical protein